MQNLVNEIDPKLDISYFCSLIRYIHNKIQS